MLAHGSTLHTRPGRPGRPGAIGLVEDGALQGAPTATAWYVEHAGEIVGRVGGVPITDLRDPVDHAELLANASRPVQATDLRRVDAPL